MTSRTMPLGPASKQKPTQYLHGELLCQSVPAQAWCAQSTGQASLACAASLKHKIAIQSSNVCCNAPWLCLGKETQIRNCANYYGKALTDSKALLSTRACVPATKTAMSETSACASRCAASTAGTSGRPQCSGESGSAASTSGSDPSSAIAPGELPSPLPDLPGLDVLLSAAAALLTGQNLPQ